MSAVPFVMDLAERQAALFHPESALQRIAHRRMAEGHVLVTFPGEYPACDCEVARIADQVVCHVPCPIAGIPTALRRFSCSRTR